MAEHQHIVREDGSIVEVAWTNCADGDFHVDSEPETLAARRAAVMDGEWIVVRQVHGNGVLDMRQNSRPEASAEGDDARAKARDVIVEADGIVTATSLQPISVQGADCAPIAFITNRGPIGVAHAGWRGLAEGIVASVADCLTSESSHGSSNHDEHNDDIYLERAIIGPVICTDCYEFGKDDLDHVASVLGAEVRGTTPSGNPALDMRAGLVAAFGAVGVTDVSFVGGCSACDETGFSHRARQEPQRHCIVAQIVTAPSAGGHQRGL